MAGGTREGGWRASGAAALLAAGVLAIACSSSPAGYPIASAYCNACNGKVYTTSDCEGFAKQAECLEVALEEPTLDDCANACTFAHCKKDVIYLCQDAFDPGRQQFATCDEQVGGKWPVVSGRPPPCNPYSGGTPNDGGPSFYACFCTRGCPCDLVCGTIPEAELPNDQFCVPPP